MIQTANINTVWSSLLVEELVRQGVTQFIIAPGSRSTPLVVAAANHEKTNTLVHFDERGAAFLALGHARATGRPAVVICTSGTAVGNCLPAVMEASADNIPLVILSADRPPELHDTGANQTIRQSHIFDEYARWSFDLPCPDRAIQPRVLLTTIDQAVHRAAGYPNGPVHINCRFREPLAPTPDGTDYAEYLLDVDDWQKSDQPYTRYSDVSVIASEEEMPSIYAACQSAERPLLVVGSLKNEHERNAVSALAKHLQWPTLADITSGLRLGHDERPFVQSHDLLLASSSFAESHLPDLCLHIGGRSVSKRLSEFLGAARPKRYIRVAEHAERIDPEHIVTDRITSTIEAFCRSLMTSSSQSPQTGWLDSWCEADSLLRKNVAPLYDGPAGLSEPVLAQTVSRLLPQSSALFLASSMPIRDMNSHAVCDGASVPVAANRGVSGIDGTIATAAGYATGTNRPVTVVIGDVALLHDLNSLALLRKITVPVTIILVNNNGGGIFTHLPIAGFSQLCKDYFVAPHHLTFSGVAQMFGLGYARATSGDEFERRYRAAMSGRETAMIEVTIDPQNNIAFRERLSDLVRSMAW